jgi:hypothetical protein
MFSFIVISSTLVCLLAALIDLTFDSSAFSQLIFPELIFPGLTLSGLLLVYFASRKLYNRLLIYIDRVLPARLDTLSTVNIPVGNYIYLRAMGDEAAGVLSLAHFLSWTMSIIGASATVPVLAVSKCWTWLILTKRRRIGAAILITCFTLWTLVAFGGLYIYSDYGKRGVFAILLI